MIPRYYLPVVAVQYDPAGELPMGALPAGHEKVPSSYIADPKTGGLAPFPKDCAWFGPNDASRGSIVRPGDYVVWADGKPDRIVRQADFEATHATYDSLVESALAEVAKAPEPPPVVEATEDIVSAAADIVEVLTAEKVAPAPATARPRK